jgi:tyrosine-protein kinase Etk/Wzc
VVTTEDGTFPNGYVTFAPAGQGGVNIIQLTGISSDPEEAARLANLYAEEYVELTKEASRTYLTSTRRLLEDQEEEIGEDLREAEDAVRAFRTTRGAAGLDAESNYLVQQIASLEAERDLAQIDLGMKESSRKALENEINNISPQLARRLASTLDEQLKLVHDRIAEKETQKADIEMRNPALAQGGTTGNATIDENYGKVTRDLQQLQNQAQQLSEQIVEEVSATGHIAGDQAGLTHVAELRRRLTQERIDISGLESKIDVLNNRIAAANQKYRTIPGQSLDLARLERDRVAAERMHVSVVERLQQARIDEESKPGYANILRNAVVPFNPIRPNRMRFLLVGLCFGIFMGIGIAVMRDKLDNRVYKPDQLRDQGYKLIGTIPTHSTMIEESYKGEHFVECEGLRVSSNLVTLLAPTSPIAEAYRHIRTNIQFSRPDRVIQTLLVTSASASEGKTTTAANLAVVMAKAGRRTLLIDADLRRPRQHEIFGIKQSPGLVQFLCDEPSFRMDLVDTGIDNLYVMPAGRVISRSSELLATKRMRDFLEDMRRQFDVIIFDTPPIRVATDASLLSTQCDATILVTRAGQTREGELDLGMDALEAVGAQIIGTVFNGFDISMAFGLKYKYHDYSRYSEYSNYSYYRPNTPKQLDSTS